MSFSQEQKSEIISQPIKSACCRRAFLEGILSSRATVEDHNIYISLDNADAISFVGELIFEIFSKKAEIIKSPRGGRRILMCFSSKSAERYIDSVTGGEISFSSKCQMCHSYFLKGVFLACGRISDPAKQYSLEFSFDERIDKFYDFFNENDIYPRISVRPNERVIYFRNSTHIEEFFGMAGMNQTLFHVMNAKIQGDLRNNTNRLVNCETNNIERAVSASMTQISLIQELMDNQLLSLLPDELERTARFRMENKDMSLSQMAGAITPPISKSGLSHRLKKITEIAEEILKTKKK